MKARLKDLFLWIGVSGIERERNHDLWDLGLDIISYVCIGVGVVSGYKGKAKKE
ncbi:hypothetical protein [Aneurinibacillus aneurinilyticus]|uniref:Uncharacterized protein n=1 Tax=Aneurinibacillus aneurinilyticus ATCC 12856 TaxID=649747 RepID=U1WQ09_ANEAE|nr:hypothetical protein [Aneurinibacillus aneurinilyticus]ERI10694.1 hypothetical protein HMPREF0083_01228 [Aneurinibacillus aneurinilyticus ATCC 12856]MED0708511.1 hypothetical protein [Aneurinibacillus aneurinilyticus]MED0723169.1 hypothetical protein [Aneurinibacillus aneurinilyticus]MED0733008.1 hypothetical protein [Aneurinibacillus aneurinilyticus]MED0739553.1 hypothetical protein [Aneurinibacillus aneurinilyticus]